MIFFLHFSGEFIWNILVQIQNPFLIIWPCCILEKMDNFSKSSHIWYYSMIYQLHATRWVSTYIFNFCCLIIFLEKFKNSLTLNPAEERFLEFFHKKIKIGQNCMCSNRVLRPIDSAIYNWQTVNVQFYILNDFDIYHIQKEYLPFTTIHSTLISDVYLLGWPNVHIILNTNMVVY